MKAKQLLCASALALLAGGYVPTALAIPIADTVNPTDITLTSGSVLSPCPSGFTCASGSITFTHNILDDGFTIGSIVNSATLAIHLTDTDNGNEDYQFIIGAGQTSSGSNVTNGSVGDTLTIPLIAASIADLQADGLLSITVKSTSRTFQFADSTLTAQVTPVSNGGGGGNGIAAVPEPMTLALLGIPALGLALTRRRKSV